MTRASLCTLTATQAADLIGRGETTSEELVDACLARIAEREGDVQAWAFLDRDHALAQARAADHARREGRGVGALNGVPVGIKDIIDTADQPTEYGSPISAGRQPSKDAACVAALRNAGAVILGKTVTTELATLTPSRTRNPANLAHTPGGSSSGSAAAVAAGMVPLALGTQTAGSVIRPASFCGICGFKPTFGLISRTGALLQSHSLDTVGVFGRSIEDLALVTDCMSAYDPADPVSYPRSQPRLLDIARQDVPLPPLFVVVKTPAWEKYADAVTKAALAELVEELGEQCQEMEIASLETAIAAQAVLQSVENAHYYGPLLDKAANRLSPNLRERLEAGARISVRQYLDVVNARERVYAVVEEVLFNYTAILTPAAPGPAPAGNDSTGNPIFNGLWTYLGVPAVTLPLLEADGLPIGVQLVGARRDDGRLLRTARWLRQFVGNE
jgi:Asp-tRNA(Asn)/Glu-tRNA(Gln) amidotransferase A subunit family amidase